MLQIVLIAVSTLVFALGCGNKEGADSNTETPAPAKAAADTAPADKPPVKLPPPTAAIDARKVRIEVQKTGYVPSSVEAKAGEKLTLVFTRTAETECGRYIQVKGTDINKELPLNQPVEIPVDVPQDGEVVFACGMDMMRGVVTVAADPATNGDNHEPGKESKEG